MRTRFVIGPAITLGLFGSLKNRILWMPNCPSVTWRNGGEPADDAVDIRRRRFRTPAFGLRRGRYLIDFRAESRIAAPAARSVSITAELCVRWTPARSKKSEVSSRIVTLGTSLSAIDLTPPCPKRCLRDHPIGLRLSRSLRRGLRLGVHIEVDRLLAVSFRGVRRVDVERQVGQPVPFVGTFRVRPSIELAKRQAVTVSEPDDPGESIDVLPKIDSIRAISLSAADFSSASITPLAIS